MEDNNRQQTSYYDNIFKIGGFWVGDSQRPAYDAVMEIAESDQRALLCIFGKEGIGKKRLLNALWRFMQENQPGTKVLLTSADKTVQRLSHSLEGAGYEAVFHDYSQYDMLLITDIQHLAGAMQTQENYVSLLKMLYESGKRIILTFSDIENSESIDARLSENGFIGKKVAIRLKPPYFNDSEVKKLSPYIDHQPSVLLLAARPGMCKTQIAAAVANYEAEYHQKKVLYISLDHSKRYMHYVAMPCQHRNVILDAENPRGADFSALTIREILNSVSSPDLIIIDYVQLMNSIAGSQQKTIFRDRPTLYRQLIKEIKDIAEDFRTTVLCVSPLARNIKNRADKRPVLSDLRLNGLDSFVDNSDVILLMYRELPKHIFPCGKENERYDKEAGYGQPIICQIAKNRFGNIGVISLDWNLRSV